MLRPATDLRSAAVLIDRTAGGAVYSCSIAEGFQQGDVFTDGEAALFWHSCGFAFLCGRYDTALLEELRSRFFDPADLPARRFVLFSEDAETVQFFRNQPQIEAQERYYFTHDGTMPALPSLPAGFRIAPMGAAILPELHGKITPRFSWTEDAFLRHGAGFCVMHGDVPAAWAFSAAVSREEVDIGVETAPDFRQRGLATIAAGEMLREALRQGRRPVWACHAGNTGSARLAERLGFVRKPSGTALSLRA